MNPGFSPDTLADAERLHDALVQLVRAHQSRDRERICCHDLTLSQWAALDQLVERGSLRLNELAAGLALDKSTASRLVDALVRKQLVQRVEDAADRRAISLAASGAGRALHQRIRRDRIQEEAALIADMAPALRQGAIELVRRVAWSVEQRAEAEASCSPAGPGCGVTAPARRPR